MRVIFLLTIFSLTFLSAQEGDKKEKNPDVLKSENWKKWGTAPIPVTDAEESLNHFKIAPGFKIELVAAEPLIKDPVFAEWDSQGRLWVCEFNTYMMDIDGSDENQRTSRVVVLEDTDGDGQMDKSTPFVSDMINPRSLSIVEGGVLIVESGKMWFCEDADNDLVCEKKTFVTEFAEAAASNIEHAENGLHFSIDNWMYNSKSSRKVRWHNGELITQPTKARGQWGMSTDSYGRLYFNANSEWFQTDWAIYDSPLSGGKYKTIKAPTKEVFPIHPTPALNRAYKSGMLNEYGNPKGVTSISGLAVHSSGAFGKEWEGAIFSFSPGTNTVGAFQTKGPFPKSKEYTHSVYKDSESPQGKREFLASTDTRFRPVNGSFGPDGCLYIVDFYRGVIQHRKFLTSYLRNQSLIKELDKHIGYGRIYRVVPENHKPVAAPTDLISGLKHPYLWWRLNTQKKIVEGNRIDLVDAIRELANDDTAKPFSRAHAMWTLESLSKLDQPTVDKAVKDSDWFVQMTALRLAGSATGNADTFPKGYQDIAKSIAKNDKSVLGDYAGMLASKGYPTRITKTFKDEEPAWVRADKNLSKQYKAGLKVYATSCGACHQANGNGLINMAPQLANSDWVDGDPARLIAVAMHGVSGPIKVNGKLVTNVPPVMPGHHSFMSDQEIADVLTYIRNAWGNKNDAVSESTVATYRTKNKSRLAPWTAPELDKMTK